MKRTSIVSLLLLSFSFAACSGGADGAAEYATTADGTEAAMPVVEPTADPASAPAADAEAGQASGASTPAAQPGFASADTAAVVAPEPGTVPGMAAVSLNPMLVRTGRAVLQVDSLERGITQVRSLARRIGAIVGNTTITAGAEESRRAEMELRIPSIAFDDAVTGLSDIGKVESVNVTAEDVGEEYTDVSSRVANARRLETRLIELLENRQGRLEEVLNLEREVARVREEIERYEGRLRYLRTRSSVSLLTIALHEPQSSMGGTPGERPILDALATAWYTFVRLVAGLIASMGVLIPLGLLGFAAWRGIHWFMRREKLRDAAYRETLRRERERAPAPAPSPAPAAEREAEIEETVGTP